MDRVGGRAESGDAGVLSEECATRLTRSTNCERAANEFVAGGSPAEDVHHFVETALVEYLGPLGHKLHTGRSRNELVATDFRCS